jgi:hypothetical protein
LVCKPLRLWSGLVVALRGLVLGRLVVWLALAWKQRPETWARDRKQLLHWVTLLKLSLVCLRPFRG